MILEFSSEAESDLEQIADYIAQDNRTVNHPYHCDSDGRTFYRGSEKNQPDAF